MSKSDTPKEKRPYLGVQFDCCGVYVRVYRNERTRTYNARCYRCGKTVRFSVGKDGSAGRFWRVS